MSHWTHVKGKFNLMVKCRFGESSPIYKIIADAPKITGSEFPAIYNIHPSNQYPTKTEDGYCHEAEITVEGSLRDRELNETCNEIENFIRYLDTGCNEKTSASGSIEVSADKVECKGPYKVSTTKTFHIYF